MTLLLFKKFKTIVTLMVLVLLFWSITPAKAAGVTLTIAPATQAVSTAGTVALSLTTTASTPVGSTLQVFRPSSYTGTASLAVSAGAIGTTSNAVSGSEVVSTATVTTAIPAGTLIVTVSGLTSPSTSANAAWKLFVGSDYGANFQYVGQANVVQVRARVPLALAFDIRNAADTAATNICDMGDLTISTVGFCEYRLKVATNARNGYTINVATSTSLSNGTDTLINAAVGTGGTGGTNIVAGTEAYGARITRGAITGSGGVTSLAATFDAGVTNFVNYNIPTSVTILSANRPNAPASTDLVNTSLVRHSAAISGSSPAGLYTQTVTYTIAPSF